MPKSSYVVALDQIQKSVAEFLHPLDFRKSGRTYNRAINDGMIHVVNFQMGQYPIGNNVIPDLRENLYGKFAVNLGVFLPCVWQIEFDKTIPKKVVQEYDCQIRSRLGMLVDGQDIWWSLDKSPEKTGKMISAYLEMFGLPFLSKYTNYSGVLSEYQAHGCLPSVSEWRSSLIAAIISQHVGDAESAGKYFDLAADYAVSRDKSGFGKYVERMRNLSANSNT